MSQLEYRFSLSWNEPMRAWCVTRSIDAGGREREHPKTFWGRVAAVAEDFLPRPMSLSWAYVESAYYSTKAEAEAGMERWKNGGPKE